MTETKEKSIKQNANTGSVDVQVTALTTRISELTEHLKVNKKDHAARRGLIVLVGKRKKLLAYLSREDSTSYLALIKKLGLRR